MKKVNFVLMLIILLLCGCSKRKSSKEIEIIDRSEYTFLFVKIPEAILPLERGEKYVDPLHEFLITENLGEVTGEGTMLTKNKEIKFVGIDLEILEPDKAIPLICDKLIELGVPEGTVIERDDPVHEEIKVR